MSYSTMKLIILHDIFCHYEMIGSVLQQFSDYQIYLFITHHTVEVEYWLNFYRKLFNFSLVSDVNDKYDLCVLPTDDDYNMCKLYMQKLFPTSTPIYIINHLQSGCRSPIKHDYATNINIHGLFPDTPCHFPGFSLTDVNQKLKNLSSKISIVCLGDVCRQEVNFLEDMQKRISNFNDIDVHIINRFKPTWADKAPSNVYFHINIPAHDMFNILQNTHYVYFFAYTRATKTNTACISMALSTLCKIVCCDRLQSIYGISTPVFKAMDDIFYLPPISHYDIKKIFAERTLLIQKTKTDIYHKLSSINTQ